MPQPLLAMRTCACGCNTLFQPVRSDQKYATDNCKARAYRHRKKMREIVHGPWYCELERWQRNICEAFASYAPNVWTQLNVLSSMVDSQQLWSLVNELSTLMRNTETFSGKSLIGSITKTMVLECSGDYASYDTSDNSMPDWTI